MKGDGELLDRPRWPGCSRHRVLRTTWMSRNRHYRSKAAKRQSAWSSRPGVRAYACWRPRRLSVATRYGGSAPGWRPSVLNLGNRQGLSSRAGLRTTYGGGALHGSKRAYDESPALRRKTALGSAIRGVVVVPDDVQPLPPAPRQVVQHRVRHARMVILPADHLRDDVQRMAGAVGRCRVALRPFVGHVRIVLEGTKWLHDEEVAS